jgi:LAO/AO transport system kinase
LQAIKRGIIELADIVVINKADLDPPAAERARQQFAAALSMLRSPTPSWRPPVLTLSAATGKGIDAFWTEVERHRQLMTANGELAAKRQRQAVDWMWTLIDSGLRLRFRQNPQVRKHLGPLSRSVADGSTTPAVAAQRLLAFLAPDPERAG